VTEIDMRASLLLEPGVVEVQSRPVPVPAHDEVVVRIAAVGVCGSDVHYYHEGRIGDFVVEEPMILGHEASGVIAAVGSGVSPDRVGERVSIEPQRACRVCEQCKRGAYNLCPFMEFYATPPIDGAFAEYAVIQADYAFPIPDSMSLDAAALCEPLSVGIWSNQKAGTRPGSRVLIAGAGPIGIIVMQVAFAFGASEVIVSDIAPTRREAAERFGATRTLDPASPEAAAEALEVDIFMESGMGKDEVALPVSRIQAREIELTGVFRYANTWPLAIELASSGRVDLDSLVTGRFPLDRVEDALRASQDPQALKVIVAPQERA
jgi:L-iditol 2-dehydrogenase